MTVIDGLSMRALVLGALALLAAAPAAAQDSTWLAAPGSTDYKDPSNWTAGLPSASGTATFGASSITSLTFTDDASVSAWSFTAGAPSYNFSTSGFTINFNGAGLVNAGNVTITNTGGINFYNTSSADNAKIVNSMFHTLTFNDDSTAGNATITNNFGGVVFYGSSTAGSAVIANTGFITFDDTSTAGNASITNDQAIYFAIQSTAGSATITTNAGGVVLFNGNATGGNARFITQNFGLVDFSASSGPNSDNKLSAGSIEGAGAYYLGANQLTVGGNNLSSIVNGIISDCGASGVACQSSGATGGSLEKVGSGTLTLSGTNTYTGATTVNGGGLIVDGSIAASSGLTVNAGAFVGGSGVLPSVTVNGGTLAPGNSIGTITISGNLTFVGAGNYVVEVSPTDADRTNVTGSATLTGTLRAVGIGGNYTVGTRYTVLNAATGINSSTFSNLVVSGNFGATRPHLEYDGYNVYLVLDQAMISPLLPNGTPNQRSVAGAVDKALLAGNTSLPFSALSNLTAAQLPAGLDALSGEVHASTAGALLDESLYVRSAVLGRLRQASFGGDARMAVLASGGPQTAFAGEALESVLSFAKSPIVTKAPMLAPVASRDIVFWAQGFGGWGTFDSDRNAAAVKRDLAGFITGFDTRVGTQGRVGFAAGYTGSRNALDGRGTSNVDTAHVAVYGGWSVGAWTLRAGGAYAWHSIDTDRSVALPGFADRLFARYDGGTGQIFGEVGYGLAVGAVAIEPFAGGAWVRVSTDAAAERGGLAALTVAGTTVETGYSTLGVRAATMIPLGHDMILIPRATAAWQHAFNDVTPATIMSFQTAPAPFVIAGVPLARDSVLAEAGLDLAIGRNATLGVSYVGQLARNVEDHAAKGKFSWKF